MMTPIRGIIGDTLIYWGICILPKDEDWKRLVEAILKYYSVRKGRVYEKPNAI